MERDDKQRVPDGSTIHVNEDDPRVLQISRDYLASLEAGSPLDKSELISRYPELSEIVADCLEGVELAHSLASPSVKPAIELSAEPLGDFKIVGEIGRGGMATVYEAIQLSLGRRVALKVLPFTASLDERQRQRFQLESHAAANLHHSNIVPVYAVGCERGVHYYAMQLIEGQSLANWIARLRIEQAEIPKPGSSGDSFAHVETAAQRATSETLTASASTAHRRKSRGRFQTIAKLVASIAEALDYAHASGVIHRDIKPANLLVDAKNKPWVTDFGLASIAADSNMTQTGDLLGTLRYMSPEQAGGKRILVDHRTDIYSLGATLYEMLCLQPIFGGCDRQQLLNNILFDEPQLLRNVDRSIPIELETIVIKALSKSPTDRYSTAADFAEDLRRFLDERPILAKRPTLIDHSRKWIRRHPSVVVSTFATLTIGVIGLSIAMAAISHEQRNTRQALVREQQRADEAEKRLQQTQKAADDMIALAEFELSDNPFEDGLRKKLLESALSHYQTVIEEQRNNPDAQAELTDTRDRVEDLLADLQVLQTDRESLILQQPEVLSDLNATQEQRNEISDWLDRREWQLRNGFERYRRRGDKSNKSNEPRVQMIADARESTSEIREILNEPQLERLKQIALQFQGSRAFHETDVINALHLTNDQRAAMREIETRHRFCREPRDERGRRGPPPQFGQPAPRDRPPRPHFDNEQRDRPRRFQGPPRPESRRSDFRFRGDGLENDERMQELLAELTSEQRKQWDNLTGPPFDRRFGTSDPENSD